MPFFRKKPVVIEAVQWDGHNIQDMHDFMQSSRINYNGAGELYIPTLEGEMTASPGDWIIKGVNGEFYPCKPDIFLKTYDLA